MQVRARYNATFNRQMIERKTDRIKREWLYGVAGSVQKFAKNSMKTVPKNPKGGKYGRQVETTYKSGKKVGQRRSYFQKGRYSAPGKPPFKRYGPPNLRTIEFSVNMRKQEVIIGPILLNGSRKMSRPVPNLHEFGGTVRRTYMVSAKKRAQVRSNQSRRGTASSSGQRSMMRSKTRTYKYPARPFMLPALRAGVRWLKYRSARSF